MLVLHGALGSATQFTELVAAVGSGARAFDFRGHGGHPLPPGEPLTIELLAEQLADEILGRAAPGVPVFGYSMGGYVALHLAATRPGLIGSITTLATKLAWTPGTAAHEATQLDPALLEAKVPRYVAALAARHTGTGWRPLLEATAAMLHRLGEKPLVTAATLARVDIPVTLMVGDRDALVSVEETLDAYRMLPQGRLAVLPGVPHPWERVPLARVVGEVRGQ